MNKRKELKAYRFAEKIMKYSNNEVSYWDAIDNARSYYEKKKFSLSDLTSHVGDDFVASAIIGKLTGKPFY